MTKAEQRWLTRCPGCDAELSDMDRLADRVSELELGMASIRSDLTEGCHKAEIRIKWALDHINCCID